VKVLAIETSMGRSSIAITLGKPGERILVRRLEGGKGHAEQLIPLLQDLMAESAISFQSLDRVAVCVGPGSFSGIRTGVAAARGIGLAANIPVVGVTSFRIMAATFEDRDDTTKTYGIVAAAGLGCFSGQIFGRGCVQLTSIVALTASEIADFFAGKAEVLAGPAATQLCLTGGVSLPSQSGELFPDAAALAAMAPGLDPMHDLPVPVYVQAADAKPQDRHVIARKAG
jgi:tRNA threonylcarbamoyladenosine biosynthesis protein TsaB